MLNSKKLDNFFINSLKFKLCCFFKKVIHYRYLIALIIFIVMVLFQINGSSIGVWNIFLHNTNQTTVILGKPRLIRSDEWRIQTPFFLSQEFTNYSLVNSNISTSGQNMIVSYGAPVWDISTLAKPLNWGYLLFGSAYGIAWYWDMKILLLILLSYEVCMIITKKNMLISVIGSFWIALSPAIQWWFMQHVCDIIFYMEAIIVLFYYYFIYHKNFWLKIVLAFLLGLACIGYALTVYPGIQIPLAYLTLLFVILIFTDFKKTIKLNKVDGLIAAGTITLIVLILIHVYSISKDAIIATLNTSYPGKRVSNGGEGYSFTINAFLTNIFIPYKDVPSTLLNNCEMSSFYNFLPAVVMALPIMIKKKANNLRYGITLAGFSLLCVGYLYLKIPIFLAKITLLSYVTSRIGIAYGISAVYVSIWALSELSKQEYIGKIYSAVVSAIIMLFYLISVYYTPLKSYARLRYYFAFILILILLNYLLMRGKKWAFSVLMMVVIVISGAMVNPITIGLSNFYNNDLSKMIRSIHKGNPNACWISYGGDIMGTYLYANGVKDLDGTNYYPDINKWKVIDPTGKYYFHYNRYSHIVFSFTNAQTTISVNNSTSIASPPDYVSVNLNINLLQKLNVSYILSSENLEQFNCTKEKFIKMTPEKLNGYYIYRVQY